MNNEHIYNARKEKTKQMEKTNSYARNEFLYNSTSEH